jgi:hypothetical protein
MLEAGWKTTSPKPVSRHSSVNTALRRAKDTFIKRGDLWELVEWQTNNLLE